MFNNWPELGASNYWQHLSSSAKLVNKVCKKWSQFLEYIIKFWNITCIYQFIVSDTSFSLGTSIKGMNHGKRTSTSPCLFKPSHCINTLFMHVLLYPILPLLLRPSILLRYVFFTNSSLFFSQIKPPQIIHFRPFLYTILNSICTSSHVITFIHAVIALTLSSCNTPYSSQITHFHSTHSGLLCPIPCPSLWSMSVLATLIWIRNLDISANIIKYLTKADEIGFWYIKIYHLVCPQHMQNYWRINKLQYLMAYKHTFFSSKTMTQKSILCLIRWRVSIGLVAGDSFRIMGHCVASHSCWDVIPTVVRQCDSDPFTQATIGGTGHR